MSDTFVPEKPEIVIRIEVSAREAHLLKILRTYKFGKIVVHKANGILVRVEPTDSMLIAEEEGIKLATR